MIVQAAYIDTLNLLIDADRDTLFEIQESLAFYAKGYQHMPLFKRKLWDGKVRIFTVSKRILPVGLLGWLRLLGESKGFEVRIAPSVYSAIVPFDDEFFLSNVAPLSRFEIMEHQVGALEAVLVSNTSLVLSPTSSGKSLILYLCCRYLYLKHGVRSLIIVPNTTLVEQMREDFIEYATDGWGPKEIHGIYTGKERDVDAQVVVSTYQTATKLDPVWFQQFGAVFVDEAHGANSKSITFIIEACAKMRWRAGFTGTLNGTYMHEMEMRARFGELVKLVSTIELMEMGIVAQLHIDAITLNYNDTVSEQSKSKNWDYDHEIGFLTTYEPRNAFLAQLATTSDDNVMILFQRREHGAILRAMIEKHIEGTGKVMYYVDGDVPIDDRKPIRAAMESRRGSILLASFGTSSVGLSIKNIHTVILGHPFKDRVRVLQTIGRGLRLCEGKTKVTVIDVGDWLSGKRKKGNVTHEHFLSRLETYQEEGFDYEVIQLDDKI